MVNLLHHLGIISTDDPPLQVNHPIIAHPSQVISIHSEHAGLFIGHTDIKKNTTKGEVLGEIVHAKHGKTLQEVTATENGFLFTVREHPLVYPNSLLYRIAKDILT
jgi:predicted deacylase